MIRLRLELLLKRKLKGSHPHHPARHPVVDVERDVAIAAIAAITVAALVLVGDDGQVSGGRRLVHGGQVGKCGVARRN